MSKLKVFFHTDFSCSKTGFARNARLILTHLYKTGKYDIVHYCCGFRKGDLNLSKTPWLSIGCLPEDEAEYRDMVGQDERSPRTRLARYGHFMLEDALKEHKPDVYIGQQDFWAFDGYTKNWWNEIPCVIHTTIDSLPILDIVENHAHKIKNLWVWSEFAEREMHKLGHIHVKTLHGAVDTDEFYRLEDKQRSVLRKIFNHYTEINDNTFVIGFVFRNQLRKSIGQLLEAFKIFKDQTNANAKILLHTCVTDDADHTWDIPRLIKDIGVDNKDILITHVCHSCHKYIVKPFEGEGSDCPMCGQTGEKALNTPSVYMGVDTDELNEIYNMMDVYCHPFTSGGQEIPIQEAKLTELPTLVTNYSCGEDLCVKGSGSFPLKWEKDWEASTNFVKARTHIGDIVDKLKQVYFMTQEERRYLGEQGRGFILENYSISAVGKKFEEFLDSQNKTEYDFSMKPVKKNPDAIVFPQKDNKKWLKELYSKILKMEVSDKDDGLEYWLSAIANGTERVDIENYFREEAIKDNNKSTKTTEVSLRDLIGFKDEKKLLFVIPESIGDAFISTSVLPSLKEKYDGYKIIVATSQPYFDVFKGNKYCDKVIQYIDIMDNELIMTGSGKQKGFVDVYIHATDKMQRFPLNYITQK